MSPSDRPARTPKATGPVGLAMPAAGVGRRMGGRRKPLMELAGSPMLLRALRPFLEHPRFQAFAVALSEEELTRPPPWMADLDPRVRLVPGGASRGESVWSAIKALPDHLELVAIHDAARPLVTTDIIDRCLEAVGAHRGAVAGWPAVDTLKRVGPGGEIRETLSRAEIWHAQTPQVFPRGLIVPAYEAAVRQGRFDTDDSALVEWAGGEVVMVRGSSGNLKVTRPQDLVLAEALLGEADEP